MNFYKDHAVIFLKSKFVLFSLKKSQTSASKMSEHSCWGFSWNTWKISLKLNKYGFVLLNRLRIAANTFFRNQKQQIIERKTQRRDSLKTSLQIHCYITIPKWLNSKSDSQVIPCSQKKESWFYLYWLRSSVQKRLSMPITWPVASHHLTWHKKCDDFWHPGAESFPTIL